MQRFQDLKRDVIAHFRSLGATQYMAVIQRIESAQDFIQLMTIIEGWELREPFDRVLYKYFSK